MTTTERSWTSCTHFTTSEHSPLTLILIITRGADKSLAWHISPCRTESIVSLVSGGGLFKGRIAILFLLQRLKGSMSVDAHGFNNIETRAVIKFFFMQGKAPKEIHAILTETLGEHVTSFVTVKNWVAQFKRADFPQLWCATSWTTQNSDHPGDYCSNSRANRGRTPDFG